MEIERKDERTIGRVRGTKDYGYTDGVICAKVARYAECVHHPERLRTPLRCIGPKGGGVFTPIGWDDALDTVAQAFVPATRRYGAEAVSPYDYAGTMGLVQRDGIHRLRHALKYSGQDSTTCGRITNTG